MLLGGPRALLMQLAHPLVAAGVAEHSSFAADPLARLRRTLDATLRIVFGTRDEADEAAAQINAVHAHVHGTLREDVGPYPAGTPYDARDPALLLWVHATLLDTTLTVYQRYVAQLSQADMERTYDESKVVARLLLVPDDRVPPTLEAFRAYVAESVASDTISIGYMQRELARDVLHPHVKWIPGPVFDVVGAVTVAMLPPKIRDGFKLAPGRLSRRLSDLSPALVRRLVPRLPGPVRYMPQARRRRLSS